jgi:hypothetical protein
MHRKLQLALAFAAGLLGGALSRYVMPPPVLAQTQAGTPIEVRAQRFVLVDDRGGTLGTFRAAKVDPHFPERTPAFVLLDRRGNEVWRGGAPGSPTY